MIIEKSKFTIKFTLDEVKALHRILGKLSKHNLQHDFSLNSKLVDAIEPLYGLFHDALECDRSYD